MVKLRSCEHILFALNLNIQVAHISVYFLNKLWKCVCVHVLACFPGHAIIPKYYYVPADFVEAEQKKHGSQKRFPSNSGRDGMLFLWGQALYNIAKLLGQCMCVLTTHNVGSLSVHTHTHTQTLGARLFMQRLVCRLHFHPQREFQREPLKAFCSCGGGGLSRCFIPLRYFIFQAG